MGLRLGSLVALSSLLLLLLRDLRRRLLHFVTRLLSLQPAEQVVQNIVTNLLLSQEEHLRKRPRLTSFQSQEPSRVHHDTTSERGLGVHRQDLRDSPLQPKARHFLVNSSLRLNVDGAFSHDRVTERASVRVEAVQVLWPARE